LELEPVMGFGLSVVMAGGVGGAFTVSDTELEAKPLELVTCTVHVRAVVPTFTGA
jgi:hypothetical protein